MAGFLASACLPLIFLTLLPHPHVSFLRAFFFCFSLPGSTCHGAGRAWSRNKSRRTLNHKDVLARLEEQGISIRVASPKLVMEEAPESYKDVTSVVDTCHEAGISKKAVKLVPLGVIKVSFSFGGGV